MTFRIKEVPKEGDSLCRTCQNVHMQRGYRESEEAVFCYYGPLRRVPFPVKDCSDYNSRLQLGLNDMERIAFVINSEPVRKPSGFVRAIGFATVEERDNADADDDVEEPAASV